MKINRITIENVKSYRDKTTFDFDQAANIFIGPNAGGKSNLLDIITVLLKGFFLRNYRATPTEASPGVRRQRVDLISSPLTNFSQTLDKFIGQEDKPSSITIDFMVADVDIRNLQAIRENRNALESKFTSHYMGMAPPFDRICLANIPLTDGTRVIYTFHDSIFQAPPINSVEDVFLNYLQFFDLMLILAAGIPNIELKPTYLFFSAYRAANQGDLSANLTGENYYDLLASYSGSTSRTSTSPLKLATLYFAQKRRDLESEAAIEGYWEKWQADPEVTLVSKYLKQVDYEWFLEPVDPRTNTYQIFLKRGDKRFQASQASSGEREIISLLFGIASFNLKGGLVIIDEPELHLHPNWQSMLRELLIGLWSETSNQFIIATHSPTFVSASTIGNIHRIFRDGTGTSRHAAVVPSAEFDPSELLHIVNSHNNEKMFFADKVVLVEGIKDRILLGRMVDYFQQKVDKNTVVEVLAVNGKSNLSKYKEFLLKFGVDTYIISDFDYLLNLDGELAKHLFIADENKIDREVIMDKKSKDGSALIRILEEAIEEENLKLASSFLAFLKGRRLKQKEQLTVEEQKLKENAISSYADRKVYVLKRGEIEDYLPTDLKQLDGIMELVKEDRFEDWLAQTANSETTQELLQIIARILGVDQLTTTV